MKKQIHTKDTPKIVVIGFDGAPFDFIQYLRGKGRITTINNLMSKGVSGVLKSTVPPASAPAWSSFLTGLNPANHGIHDFVDQTSLKPNTSRNLKGRTVADYLSQMGYKTILVNIPLTSPAFAINGIMVSGFPAPSNQPDIYPPFFRSIFFKHNEKYEIDVEFKEDEANEKEYLEKIYDITRKRLDAISYLLKNFEYDFFMAVFTTLDRIQHNYYGYSLEGCPLYNEEKKDVLLDYYDHLDYSLKQILDILDEDTYIIILSDHGFEYVQYRLGLTKVILDFIHQKDSYINKLIRSTRRYINNNKKLNNIALEILKLLPLNMTKNINKVVNAGPDTIKFSNYPFIKFNIQNQERKNIYIDNFIKYIKNIRNPINNEQIIDEIYYTKEVYDDQSQSLGEIMMFLKDGYVPSRRAEGIIAEPASLHGLPNTGTHQGVKAQRGFYCIYNKHLEKQEKNCEIIDMTPTILKLFGITRDDLDGKPII